MSCTAVWFFLYESECRQTRHTFCNTEMYLEDTRFFSSKTLPFFVNEAPVIVRLSEISTHFVGTECVQCQTDVRPSDDEYDE